MYGILHSDYKNDNAFQYFYLLLDFIRHILINILFAVFLNYPYF